MKIEQFKKELNINSGLPSQPIIVFNSENELCGLETCTIEVKYDTIISFNYVNSPIIQIQKLIKTLCRCETLLKIKLENCGITNLIDLIGLNQLNQLKILDLSNNLIEKTAPLLFMNLKCAIILNGNPIKSNGNL